MEARGCWISFNWDRTHQTFKYTITAMVRQFDHVAPHFTSYSWDIQKIKLTKFNGKFVYIHVRLRYHIGWHSNLKTCVEMCRVKTIWALRFLVSFDPLFLRPGFPYTFNIVCAVLSTFLKIWSSFIGSPRMYHLKRFQFIVNSSVKMKVLVYLIKNKFKRNSLKDCLVNSNFRSFNLAENEVVDWVLSNPVHSILYARH